MVCHALLVVLTQNKSSRGRRCDTRSTWTEGEKRLEAGLIVGLRRRFACAPGRSGAVSPRLEPHVCPQSVTREPSSSWIAHTSQQCAF